AAARRIGLELVVLKAATDSEIENSVAAAVEQQAAALSIGSDAYLSSRSRQIAFFALRHALPTMASTREYVTAGILMSYGTSLTGQLSAGRRLSRPHSQGRHAGEPSDPPADQFELLINMTTAKAIGLKIPESFLLRADEVIE